MLKNSQRRSIQVKREIDIDICSLYVCFLRLVSSYMINGWETNEVILKGTVIYKKFLSLKSWIIRLIILFRFNLRETEGLFL